MVKSEKLSLRFCQIYTKWPLFLGRSHQERPIFWILDPTPNDPPFLHKILQWMLPVFILRYRHIPFTFIFECPPALYLIHDLAILISPFNITNFFIQIFSDNPNISNWWSHQGEGKIPPEILPTRCAGVKKHVRCTASTFPLWELPLNTV